jgi:hypothetical protein
MLGMILSQYPMEIDVSAIAGSKRELTEGTDGLAGPCDANLEEATREGSRQDVVEDRRFAGPAGPPRDGELPGCAQRAAR